MHKNGLRLTRVPPSPLHVAATSTVWRPLHWPHHPAASERCLATARPNASSSLSSSSLPSPPPGAHASFRSDAALSMRLTTTRTGICDSFDTPAPTAATSPVLAAVGGGGGGRWSFAGGRFRRASFAAAAACAAAAAAHAALAAADGL